MPIIQAFPELFISPASATALHVLMDVLPADAVDFDLWLPRVRVGGVEVMVRPGVSIDAGEQAAGKTATFTLLDAADKARFTDTASIDIGVGKLASAYVTNPSTMNNELTPSWSATAWEILGGSVAGVTHEVTGNDPVRDKVTVTVRSSADDRLNRTSEKGLTIYDPNRVTITSSDFETLYDKAGNAYVRETKAIPGLKLSHLFNEILINRCGFASYETNLPERDYPIQRYDVPMGGRFYDALKGFIGMYSPRTPAAGDKISIMDSTIALPAGLPAPRQVVASEVSRIGVSSERQNLNALMLQFVGLENNYDFTTPRFKYETTADGGRVVEIEQIFIEFRKITGPGTSVVVREALNIENKTTTVGGIVVEETSDNFLFNSSGDYASRERTVRSLLPDLYGGFQDLLLQISAREREQMIYAPHPFKPRSKYLSSRLMTREGLVTHDPDNPNYVGDPARQSADIAYRSNNIATGQTYSFEIVRTRSESSMPQRDGTVITRTVETDTINPNNCGDSIETRPGDIGVNGYASSSKQMPVFAPGDTTRSLKRVEPFQIGELPLKYGIPLAERVLTQKQTADQKITATFQGYDPSLELGVPISVYDRDGVSFGNFVIVGRSVSMDASGLTIELSCRQIAGSAASLQDIEGLAASIRIGETQTWVIPIECSAGFSLYAAPTDSTRIFIQARHVETPPADWTNLTDSVGVVLTPASEIDLTPWDGTTQDFEFRITAVGTMTTRTEFDLRTRS